MSVRRRLAWPFVLVIGFAAGALTDWWLTTPSPSGSQVVADDQRGASRGRRGQDVHLDGSKTDAELDLPVAERTLGTSGGGLPSLPIVGEAPSVIRGLLLKGLLVPVAGADPAGWKGGFEEGRPGHRHEAVDILAPRGTPVLAVDDGVVAKLFNSKNGGITLYQFDLTRRYCYYYAHLERYADGIREGDALSRGQVIAYVGTTGNAPPDTPHLHFAIFQLADGEGWWQGRPVDPYLAYGGDRQPPR